MQVPCQKWHTYPGVRIALQASLLSPKEGTPQRRVYNDSVDRTWQPISFLLNPQ